MTLKLLLAGPRPPWPNWGPGGLRPSRMYLWSIPSIYKARGGEYASTSEKEVGPDSIGLGANKYEMPIPKCLNCNTLFHNFF